MKLKIDLSRMERARESTGADKAEIGELASKRPLKRKPIDLSEPRRSPDHQPEVDHNA